MSERGSLVLDDAIGVLPSSFHSFIVLIFDVQLSQVRPSFSLLHFRFRRVSINRCIATGEE